MKIRALLKVVSKVTITFFIHLFLKALNTQFCTVHHRNVILESNFCEGEYVCKLLHACLLCEVKKTCKNCCVI